MKRLFIVAAAIFFSTSLTAQSVLGKWTTYDDETKKAKSEVEIYEKGGEYFAKIVKLLNRAPGDENPKCTACKGDKKDKPMVGMVIVENMKRKGDKYEGGTITNPKDGKVYTCKFYLDEDNANTLVVKGYVGPFSRAQYWKRLK